MGIISIDLGTTNIKVASYDDKLTQLTLESAPVSYLRDGCKVEFDADEYYANIENLIERCFENSKPRFGDAAVQLVLTGQAESLVLIDQNGQPVRHGISWLDMRSQKECDELAAVFDQELCYAITGQPEIIPTWPLTKILWLKRHEPENFAKTFKFLLLKDYVIFRLTGKLVGEYSIYPFSHYFNIKEKCFWQAPLEYCGVGLSQLPELIEPCSVAGKVLSEVCQRTGLPFESFVNAGTLDHFAGMIGTGNIREGLISESAGTVLSIATFASSLSSANARIPLYCGPFKDSYIYLPVCESGGISLEWFKNNFLEDLSFKEIDAVCQKRQPDPKLTFLPYLTGVNSPEFDPNARGVFFGATAAHDKYDFALAVMYGVASLLRKNLDFFSASGISAEKIISTGGGAKSALWSQIKADICNVPVIIPSNQESPSLGSAIIGAVSSGIYPDYQAAIDQGVQMGQVYLPSGDRTFFESKYQFFKKLYEVLTPMFNYK